MCSGTFPTSHDVRFESGMRSKADECASDSFTVDARGGAIFHNGFTVICLVQTRFQKLSALHLAQITSSSLAIPFRRGALAIVTNVGVGCGGRGSVGRA